MSDSTGNRFAPITPDDHAGSVWIAGLLCLTYSTLILALRVHLRRKMYGLDSWLATAATILQLGEVLALIVALQNGIGQALPTVSASDRIRASQAIFASQILFVLALSCAKCSVLWLMMHLFSMRGYGTHLDDRSRILWWMCATMISMSGIWGILSIVALCANCSALEFTQRSTTAQCPNLLLRWRLISSFDIATELLICVIAVFIVWPLQMSLRLKSQVVLAFAFRLPIVMLAILHLHYVGNYAHSTKPGLAIVPVLVCQQIELCWSLISATIPNLKSFVKSFSSGFGLAIDPDATVPYGSRAKYGTSHNYELHSVGKHRAQLPQKEDVTVAGGEDPKVSMQHQGEGQNSHLRDESSIGSRGSQDNIIRKDQSWDIRYEERR